jgi:phage tail-like protein
MAGGRKTDPLFQGHFYLTVGTHIKDMVFRECSGIGSESEVIEYKAASQKDYNTIAAIPGRLKWQKINLKRGITDSMEAWTWRKLVEDGKVAEARADGTVTMVSQDGVIMAQWTFDFAWPTKITGPSLNSSSNEVGLEELEIVHEGLRRVKV